jgi:ParB family chromosome partitioning protein
VFWSRQIPIEVTDLTLTEEDRLRVWIYIHYKRKEWDAKEKETVAYGLVMGRASAANILGITVRELDKLVDVFEWSEKFTSLRDPSAAITWARELMVVGKKLFTPTVVEAVVNKVIQKPITNFEDLRKLRTILRDLVARAFLERPGAILNLRFCAPARLRVFALRLTGGNEAMLPSRTSDSWSILLTSQYLLD